MASTNASTSSSEMKNSKANNEVLSKSKKKRMKQKASKAKREAEKKNQKQNPTSNGAGKMIIGSTASLNPHEKLCHDLGQHGYTPLEIENALEEMWNLDMQYDDFQAALAFLESKKAQKEADAEREMIAQAVAVTIENRETSEVEDKAEEESALSESSVVEAESNTENSSAPAPAVPPSVSGSESKSQTKSQSMDLSSKLNLVANFEVLSDAIIALSEWVTKAATLNQLNSLCESGSNESPPLNTIIERIIKVPTDSEYENLEPSIVSLATGILELCNSHQSTTAVNSLKGTLEFVREAIELSKSNPLTDQNGQQSSSMMEAITDSVSDQICESFKFIISQAISSSQSSYVKNSQTNGASAKQAQIRKLESEIESLLIQQPPMNGGDGVMQLMTRRDCRKAAAEKSAMIAKLMLPPSISIPNKAQPESNWNEESKLILLSKLFNGQCQSYQQNRSTCVSLENQLTSVNSTWAQEKNQIAMEMDSCETKLTQIQRRKEELQQELDQLTNESEKIKKRQNQLKTGLESIYNSSSTPEINNLKMELKKRAGIMEVEDKVTGILDKLDALVNALKEKPNESVKMDVEELKKMDPSEMQSKLESFLILAKSYFTTEADCVRFMSNRVSSIRHDAKELQREIAECTALGMATNVSKMMASLETYSSNAEEDERVILLLRNDAERMRDVVIEKTSDYLEVGNILTTNHENLLRTMGNLFTRIGIARAHVFFNTNEETMEKKPMFTKSQEYANGAEQNGHATTNGEAAAPLKLSWASRSTPKSTAKSLVDIQKEELSRKA